MTELLKYKKLKILAHIVLWIISVIFLSFLFHFYGESYSVSLFIKSFVINFVFAIIVYINLYFLLPLFLKTKKYIYYIFWLVFFLTALSIILQFLFIFPLKGVFSGNNYQVDFNPNLHSAYFFSALFYVIVTTFFKLIKDWISFQDVNLRLAKIEQQKLEAELATLKSQLNPHFLFNSLNNIYSLSLTKSEKVPVLILKLADLMRHIIYDSKENYIGIEKELEFVNNFIELQRIRTSEKTTIKFEIIGQIPSAKIAPLLFEPFIDNAFKHGLPGNEANDYIEITFKFIPEKKLFFHIKNNFNDSFSKKQNKTGIGLENVKQRLKLLYQPEEFKLEIHKSMNIFSVELELLLK